MLTKTALKLQINNFIIIAIRGQHFHDQVDSISEYKVPNSVMAAPLQRTAGSMIKLVICRYKTLNNNPLM